MNLWNRIVKWCSEQPEQKPVERVTEKEHAVRDFLRKHDIDYGMVGEPIKSVVRDVLTNPRHWRMKFVKQTCPKIHGKYLLIEVTHHTSGKVFEVETYCYTSSIYSQTSYRSVKVKDLGFNLNGWEQRALYQLFQQKRQAAWNRKCEAGRRKLEAARLESDRKEIEARESLKLELGI
ncbi:hypothetical protein PMW_179 [Pseudomonas phage phiPMW]|uniref:Uncharacterized protein n=1 Tax=Pseudomonas phage phiPMW TaxID=1815582 RepID=A0A1S5R1N4_9CAUD|nr:hypothetical protein FDG97_gp171 [Pseudomonas phage phiPMW]ANA49304.1 hypothetical protein PMW_179 [Pseudomonas phage phiPMW]